MKTVRRIRSDLQPRPRPVGIPRTLFDHFIRIDHFILIDHSD